MFTVPPPDRYSGGWWGKAGCYMSMWVCTALGKPNVLAEPLMHSDYHKHQMVALENREGT